MNANQKESLFVRTVDVKWIVALLTIISIFFAVAAKPAQWDQTIKEVADIKVTVTQHDRQLATITAQYGDIRDELHAINRKLGR